MQSADCSGTKEECIGQSGTKISRIFSHMLGWGGYQRVSENCTNSYAKSLAGLAFLEFFHDAANELFGRIQGFENDLQVHGWLVGLARALTIDAMLPHQDKGVREQVQSYGQASAGNAHHEFVFIEVVALIVEQRHGLGNLTRRRL